MLSAIVAGPVVSPLFARLPDSNLKNCAGNFEYGTGNLSTANSKYNPTVKQTPARRISVGKARAEGMRLFKLAGRPSKDDFIKVYGANGPVMTWAQRAAAGVPATKFQAAPKAKQSGR